MQWNNSEFQQQTERDVYADIRTSYSAGFGQENQDEFSLSSIQERLGEWNTIDEQDSVTSADLRPSEQTLRMSYQREYAASSTKTATRLNTKTKVAIASYAVVVLALIIAVTLCSVSVSGAFGSAALLNAEYSEVSSAVEGLLAATQEEDFADLAQRAADLGYIDAAKSNTMEYTELETRPAQNFHVESNWFDSLCDWLCGVFGG
ncbi:MAG: hypothetical protein J1F68_05135 [Clostridiales bacterium]|nr:hypothetical protein [Clostridiales bacterium]